MSEMLELRKELEETQSRLRRLEELQDIFQLWVRLKEKLFPAGCSGQDVRGMDLVLLDSNVAGCVSTFLTRGGLDEKQQEYLYFCNDCLDTVTLELHEYEGWYFRQLKALTSAIIEFQRKW